MESTTYNHLTSYKKHPINIFSSISFFDGHGFAATRRTSQVAELEHVLPEYIRVPQLAKFIIFGVYMH
jgi:hypothetical protein